MKMKHCSIFLVYKDVGHCIPSTVTLSSGEVHKQTKKDDALRKGGSQEKDV